MPVNTPRKDYLAALPAWNAARDCYDGSRAVKAAGPDYLPPLDSQKGYEKGGHNVYSKGQAKYLEYKQRAVFYNGTARTVDGLAGAIFQKAPKFDVPTTLEDQLKDVTLTRMSSDLFGLMSVKEVLKKGRVGVLVDMAPVTAEKPDARPYWILYHAEDIISWRVNEDKKLVYVVLREFVESTDEKDPFVMTTATRFRVLWLIDGVYQQTLYVRDDPKKEDSWAALEPVVPTRREQPLPFIPFTVFGPTSVSPDIEKGPLEDLIEINLAHYRSSADLAHGLHCAALPTPVVIGARNQGEGLYLGSGTAWSLAKGGTAMMLEVAGPGFASIAAYLAALEDKMATLGARLLEKKPDVVETATAVQMRHSGEHATLSTLAQTAEQAISLVLQYHAWWIGTDEHPDDVEASCELNKDYWSAMLSAADLKAAVLMLQAGAISYPTFYYILQSGGWAREDVTASQELKEIQKTGPVATQVNIGKQGAPPKPPGTAEDAGALAATIADEKQQQQTGDGGAPAQS